MSSRFLRKNKLNGTLPRWLTNLTRSKVDVSENFFTNVTIPTDNISANLNLFACCNTTHQLLKWQEANYHCENDSYTNDHLYINCGGIGVTINGSNYEADMQKEGGSTFYLSPGKTWAYSSMGASFVNDHDTYIVNKTCNISLEDELLYQNARVSPLSLKYYGFCLKNGHYTLKLHFAEIVLDDPGFPRERIFDVDIQGGQHYLPDFDIKEEAGGLNKNITRVFNITVQNRRLEIHLYSSSKSSTSFLGKYNGPLISAISLSRVVKHQKLSSAIIGVIAGSATLFAVLMLFVFWKLGWLGGKSSKDKELKAIELFPGGVLTFRQIKAATKNFDPENKIGEGGFGVVYKGVLANGTQVAVKQLSAKSKQGAREFINEIGTTYALQHQNLVRLIGCCAEQHQLLLVYEYMENNSLEHALFGAEDVKSRLTWLTRVKICCDIGRGLAFLHGESRLKIMHRDIKPTNILLDKDFNAKISDFGYAKLNEDEDNQLTTKIAGTTGYMAPEYMLGYVTPKADVYSFGIVMLEIFSGKNISIFRPRDQTVYLLDTAYEYQRQGNLIALLDAKLGSDYTYNEALKILNLAMECVNAAPKLRPGMSEVVKVLEGVLKVESKRKSKNKSTGNTSVVNSVIASPETSFSQSTQSWSTSQEGASNTTISISTDKEIMSTSAD